MLPGPSGGRAHFWGHYRHTVGHSDLDGEDMDFLAGHLAVDTASGYGYAFNHFKTFCEDKNVDPFTCSPSVVIKYIRFKFNEGYSYSTINYHRSSISKFHAGFEGSPIGEHFLVCQALKSVFRQRPPLPKYLSTFDIQPVLNYIANLEPLSSLSLKALTMKTFFLICFSTLSRVSSVARLGPAVKESRVSGQYSVTNITFNILIRIV